MSFDELGGVVDFLVLVQNQDLVKENKEKLLKLPVCKWKSQLEDWRGSGLGGTRHNDTFKYYITDLQEKNWKIGDKQSRLLKKGPNENILDILEGTDVKPDNMQYSIAIYAVASLHRRPKQLWMIHAGQGKSRIIAAAAFHALTESNINNVHIVYPTAHLMERD